VCRAHVTGDLQVPAFCQRTAAPVGLLVIEEEPLVKAADLLEARIKAVALAAGAGANTQVFPEQNGSKKIVVIRLTIVSDQAPALIARLSGLGTLADRQDESRDITALYNETLVLCNDLESRRSAASDPAELQQLDVQIASYRQQLDAWAADAGKRIIMLWLEN